VNILHKGDDDDDDDNNNNNNNNIYTNAKSGNPWHMFNCKKFPKLHIRPPSLILLMIHPRIGENFPAKGEK
jgi:hypothetical protein